MREDENKHEHHMRNSTIEGREGRMSTIRRSIQMRSTINSIRRTVWISVWVCRRIWISEMLWRRSVDRRDFSDMRKSVGHWRLGSRRSINTWSVWIWRRIHVRKERFRS
jgi:hypothetical protein